MALDLSALRRIIADENRLLTGADIPAEYQSDVLGRVHGSAEALAFPLSTEEVSALLRYAHEHRVPVTPRGAGTNLVGSTVPLEGGIILDLSRMDRVLELDEDTMTVTVEPGMLLQDLQAYVEARGLFYPPDPGEKASSIGGNISTNAGGMRAVKYGVTRDYVRGLEVVLADGTVVQVGGKQVKDASGLSLKHLLIGSEGTLAVITKCLLRLVPKPEASLSVLVPYADLKTGIQSVLTILRANANPTAVEFMERKVVALGERFCGVSYPRPDALANGDIDLNAFQHRIYLQNEIDNYGYAIQNIGNTFIIPLNLYSQKVSSVDELKDGDVVAIPDDLTNGGRALKVLEAAGLIELDPSAAFNPTVDDITSYKVNITIEELKANTIPSVLPDVAAAVVNGNYALDFGLKTDEAIYKDSVLDVEEYWNLIAARTADIEDPDTAAIYEKVVEAFQSSATEDVFNNTFGGYFIAVGWDQDLINQ